MAEGGRELSQAAFGMALIPRGHKTPGPNTITLNVRISTYEFGSEGAQTFNPWQEVTFEQRPLW